VSSIQVSFHVQGAKEAAAALRQLPVELERKVLRTALRKVATPIRDTMAEYAPRLTGELAAHILITATPPVGQGSTAALVIGPDRKRFYGMFAEFGTKRQPARPWMRPAIDYHSQPAIESFGLFVWQALAALARRLAKGR
jgi:HK97 gp10 family phage protein